MKNIKIEDLKMNPFTLLSQEWCLIGASSEKGFNAMTASWGGFGVLWNKNVVTIYIRPQRYTREFIEEAEAFTLNFFAEHYKKELGIYGSQSGRDIDKEKETGFTKIEDHGCTYFKEAKLVLECRKIYCGNLTYDNMIDKELDCNYPNKDYHFVYIGEIMNILCEESYA